MPEKKPSSSSSQFLLASTSYYDHDESQKTFFPFSPPFLLRAEGSIKSGQINARPRLGRGRRRRRRKLQNTQTTKSSSSMWLTAPQKSGKQNFDPRRKSGNFLKRQKARERGEERAFARMSVGRRRGRWHRQKAVYVVGKVERRRRKGAIFFPWNETIYLAASLVP